ncbi:MAG: phage replisome organizer N-terminal domain-containing protein [Clostridia bacterium]|jgi:predicted phage replisome organizer|nr:phage replisome organizer N-terminal domain-containing protein [Clostridia bacterium]
MKKSNRRTTKKTNKKEVDVKEVKDIKEEREKKINYRWLRLHGNFYDRRVIRLLKRHEEGNTMVVIYQRLLLNSFKTGGLLSYEGVLPTLEEELELELGENIKTITEALKFFLEHELLVEVEENVYFLPEFDELVGKECDSASRVRRHREKQKKLALQCNTEKEKELEESNIIEEGKNELVDPVLLHHMSEIDMSMYIQELLLRVELYTLSKNKSLTNELQDTIITVLEEMIRVDYLIIDSKKVYSKRIKVILDRLKYDSLEQAIDHYMDASKGQKINNPKKYLMASIYNSVINCGLLEATA